MPSTPTVHLAVALDGAGWHPAAWREDGASPTGPFSPGYWVDLVAEAERGLLDFVTFEDSLSLQSDDPLEADRRTDRIRGRLDATLIAARVAPTTRHIGLLPTAIVTHTEPFHLSKAIATLDYVSRGRAGVRVQVTGRTDTAALFGRRDLPLQTQELFDEAADYVEVLRRLWDSWEDDAEIRDAATGRFVDRDRLHYIDFVGRHFSVKGPAITPRPPQGQPLVAALAHQAVPYQLVGRACDIGFVTPQETGDVAPLVARIRSAQDEAGRRDEPVHVFGDLLVYLDETGAAAEQRRARLDEAAGAPYRSDALTFTGTAAGLADLVSEWCLAGLSGLRLRPAALPHDLEQISRRLVPELQRRGLFRQHYEADTLRGLLGLPRPANRYAQT